MKELFSTARALPNRECPGLSILHIVQNSARLFVEEEDVSATPKLFQKLAINQLHFTKSFTPIQQGNKLHLVHKVTRCTVQMTFIGRIFNVQNRIKRKEVGRNGKQETDFLMNADKGVFS
jgi:hypothetical protein